MKVNVKYFGMIAEAVDKTEEVIEFNTQDFPVLLDQFFKTRYPQLTTFQFQCAIDHSIAKTLAKVTCNEIAVLPPFAGG